MSLDGAPETIRTSDLSLRRGPLYPTELRGLMRKAAFAQRRILAHSAAQVRAYSPILLMQSTSYPASISQSFNCFNA